MNDSAEHDRQQDAMVTAPPARRSAWTTRQKIIRLLWGTFGKFGWQFASLRPVMLRLFGGTVGTGCRLARRIDIAIPWNITLGDDVVVHERCDSLLTRTDHHWFRNDRRCSRPPVRRIA